MADHVDPYRVYLHHPDPLRDESGGKPMAGTDVAADPSETLAEYYGEHSDKVHKELSRLFDAFQLEVYYGNRHFAPSPTWRDELATRLTSVPTLSRFVLRVHLFERRGDSPGKYLGFASLRPPAAVDPPKENSQKARFGFNYVIDAELTIPSHLQRPRYHVITTTASSARLGVLPFRSAVYSAAGSSELRKSTCVHLAVSQALHLIMGRFPCRPISQIEFDRHLWEVTDDSCGSIQTMGERGAKLTEALKVVRKSCNGGGFVMSIEPRSSRKDGKLAPSERQLAQRYLTDALACGLPVIALVHAGSLLPTAAQKVVPKKDGDIPHAVLMLGMHLLHCNHETQNSARQKWHGREDLAELPGRVVLHDTLVGGPYYEQSVFDFFEAAENAYEGQSGAETGQYSGLHFLVIGPKDLRLGHPVVRAGAETALKGILEEFLVTDRRLGLWLTLKSAVIRCGRALRLKRLATLNERECESLRGYLDRTSVKRKKAMKVGQWRMVCRFLSVEELRERYKPAAGLSPLVGDLEDLQPGYYWVVETRHPLAMKRRTDGESKGELEAVDMPPAFVYIWDCARSRDDNDSPDSKGNEPSADAILSYTQAEKNHGRSS